MASKDITLLQDKFYGGINRDDKAKPKIYSSNIEEIDIFANEDYVQAEQIMSADTLPATSELYSITGRDDGTDTVYGLGKETSGGLARIFVVASGGADNPGAWATEFTSAETSLQTSPIVYFKTSEATATYLYYITGSGATTKLMRYNLTSESNNDSGATAMTLDGMPSTFARPWIKKLYGELFIGHGNKVAKVNKDGVFTKEAFTLPAGMESVDMVPASDVAIILARHQSTKINQTIGYWWDLTDTAFFDDRFFLPMGGPQWITNYRENIIMFCSVNGTGRFFQLSGAWPGAVPMELTEKTLSNMGAETDTQPISPSHSISHKDGVLYFNLFKTDKSGIYALGQVEARKPIALILSKRFDTSSYATHTPYGLHIQGPNFYAAFDDNGTADASRCESNNSPSRSSNAVIETVWFDDDKPYKDKKISDVYMTTYPLPASTSLALSMDTDYSGSYTAINMPDGNAYQLDGATIALYRPTSFANKKAFKSKIAFTSSTTNSVKLTSFALRFIEQDGR